MSLSPEILQLLAQIPLVGIFVVFVLIWSSRNEKAADRRDELMRTFLGEQRKADREVLAGLSAAVDRINGAFGSHDDKMDKAIATMMERTRGRAHGI